jgi:opine dehydrogenase
MSPKKTWAVIGGGNGGQSAAGHLGMMGFPVRFYDIFPESVEVISGKGGIEVTGVLEGFGKVELATTNLSKAIEGADIVMVIAPATAHRAIARDLAKDISPGQVVFIHPGATLGALEFYQVFAEAGIPRGSITICEAQSLVYATRLVEHGKVSIKGIKQSLAVGALPAERIGTVILDLQEAYPQMKAAKNILETSLTNMNAVMHPTPSLLSTSLIESKFEWKYYLDGISPSIGALVEKLDAERVAIGKAAGIAIPSALELYKNMYDVSAPTLSETVKLNKAYWEISGQKKIDTRYITEDIPTGLVPMIALADLFGVPCEIMKTIAKLGSLMLGRDLIGTGRTLENLGLSKFTPSQFLEFIEKG